MQYVIDDDDDSLADCSRSAGEHEQRAAQSFRLQATSLPFQRVKRLLMQTFGLRRRAGEDRGKAFSERFHLVLFRVAALKVLQHHQS